VSHGLLRHRLVPAGEQRGTRHQAARAAAGVQAVEPVVLRRPHDREHVAADAGHLRFDDVEHGRRRDRRVDRVAAALEHPQGGGGGEWLAGRGHPVGGVDGGAMGHGRGAGGLGYKAQEKKSLHIRSMMAAATSRVVAVPPASGLRTPAARVSLTARSRARAGSAWPSCSNISAPVSTAAIGFATPLPASGGAEPWTGSNSPARPGCRLALAARPSPPTRPAPRSERMSPYRLLVTMTWNRSGSRTSSSASASTYRCSGVIAGYSFEIALNFCCHTRCAGTAFDLSLMV